MDDVTDTLEQLLEQLEARVEPSRRRDGIDAILAGSPRSTTARSLRDHEVVERFRRELSDGLIRVDTIGRLLNLIRVAVETALK